MEEYAKTLEMHLRAHVLLGILVPSVKVNIPYCHGKEGGQLACCAGKSTDVSLRDRILFNIFHHCAPLCTLHSPNL